jgi:hypothetical protein
LTDADPGAGTDDLASADAEYKAIIADVRTGYARTRHGVKTIEYGVKTIEFGHAEFRDGAWQSATALGRLREFAQKNDRVFGAMLTQEPELDEISKDDRWALIEMSKYPDITKSVLATTERTSLQNIWRKEIKPLVDRIDKDKNTDNKDADDAADDDDDLTDTDDDHSYDTNDESDTDDSNENADTDDDRPRPPRGSRNRIPPIVTHLKTAARGVEELYDWCRREIDVRYPFTAELEHELEHEVRVKLRDLLKSNDLMLETDEPASEAS